MITFRFPLHNGRLSCFHQELQDPMQPVYSECTPEEHRKLSQNVLRAKYSLQQLPLTLSPPLLDQT